MDGGTIKARTLELLEAHKTRLVEELRRVERLMDDVRNDRTRSRMRSGHEHDAKIKNSHGQNSHGSYSKANRDRI
jgi:hypothetical protein